MGRREEPPEQGEPLDLKNGAAEESVLGGLMMVADAWDRIGDLITAEHFASSENGQIFRAISQLIEGNKPADVLTVSEQLRRAGKLEAVGGFEYLHNLVENTPSAANIRVYAEIVRNGSLMRQMASAIYQCNQVVRYPGGKDASAVLDECQALWMSVQTEQAKAFGGFKTMSALLGNVMEHLDDLFKRPPGDDLLGWPSGFVDLDHRTCGMIPGDLIIVAGRPSMGKTAFSINIAEHVAVRKKLPVLVFSMEMSGEQIAMRVLASASGVNSQRLRTGRLYQKDWEHLNTGLALLNDAPLQVDDQPALSIGTLRARARQALREHGVLGLIVVDYLQLMSSDTSRHHSNRSEEISEISRGLKALAKELRVPVMALSQLNRGLETRPNKRPVMSDLRESGAIEQDADVILFIYRDEVYREDSPDKGTAEIIIGKQRNGPIGTVRLAYRGDNTRFANLEQNNHG